MSKDEFHIGVALFRAWQTTIQTGMGAWYEMTKYNGTQQKSENQLKKGEIFLSTWSFGEIFCTTTHRVRWQLVRHQEFLPRDLANRYKRFRAGLSQPRVPSSEVEETPPPQVSLQDDTSTEPVS